jgi:hypothetical protein
VADAIRRQAVLALEGLQGAMSGRSEVTIGA